MRPLAGAYNPSSEKGQLEGVCPALRLQAGQEYAAGNLLSVLVESVPARLVESGLASSGDEGADFLACDIVDDEVGPTGLWQ